MIHICLGRWMVFQFWIKSWIFHVEIVTHLNQLPTYFKTTWVGFFFFLFDRGGDHSATVAVWFGKQFWINFVFISQNLNRLIYELLVCHLMILFLNQIIITIRCERCKLSFARNSKSKIAVDINGDPDRSSDDFVLKI